MTVYDIPNIEHCDVTVLGGILYRLIAHEGWYIYKSNNPVEPDENGNPTKLYQTAVIINPNLEDLSGIEITAEADLPDNAIINGVEGEPDHEVM